MTATTSGTTILIVVDTGLSERDLLLRRPSLRDAAVASLALPKGDFVDHLLVDGPREVAPEAALRGLFQRAGRVGGGQRNPYVAPKRRPPKSIGAPRR